MSLTFAKERKNIDRDSNDVELIADSAGATLVVGGDEGILEGASIGENHNEELSSDSESDDDGIIIHVSGVPNIPSTKKKSYEKGSNSYIRPELLKDTKDTKPTVGPKKSSSEELKALQFSYHQTAFDINMDDLEEYPWRQPHTDISDFFNYGFNEATWLLYCEKQLRKRMAEGGGPQANQPDTVSVPVPTTTVSLLTPTPPPVPPSRPPLPPPTPQQVTLPPPVPKLPPPIPSSTYHNYNTTNNSNTFQNDLIYYNSHTTSSIIETDSAENIDTKRRRL